MSQAVIATSHRALTSNAGNARVYAEQLLARICRRWGVPLHEVRGNRHVGRRTENLVTKAVMAEFLVEVLPLRVPLGWNGKAAMRRDRLQLLSCDEIGDMLGISSRSVRRSLDTIEDYRSSPPDATRSEKGQSAALSSTLDDRGQRLTGYDRASLEELVEGGGGR